ncbi:hypothetical protein O3M35_012694 [Rhynocoris fuscipes]|uniref:Ubiquitin-conjugating enzyme E2-18 kDa n=1 Tax=Rhynocoris fuscipes TaxID=488301 RepID=A0AAW1CVS5_9HEMI
MKYFRDLEILESNFLHWRGLLLPENPPYNKGAFKIDIIFPVEYPLKAPKIIFLTKIYHPNIDEKGNVCLPIITAENWKPAIKIEQIIEVLIALINSPDTELPLRADVAQELVTDRDSFMKKASEFTEKHAETRPVD